MRRGGIVIIVLSLIGVGCQETPGTSRNVAVSDPASPPCETPEVPAVPSQLGKDACQKCQAKMEELGSEYVCGYRCTFCESCAHSMEFVCPNCSGKLELNEFKP